MFEKYRHEKIGIPLGITDRENRGKKNVSKK